MKKVIMTPTDTRIPMKNSPVCSKCKGRGVVQKKIIDFVVINIVCPICSEGVA